jgi:hypothetical protein
MSIWGKCQKLRQLSKKVDSEVIHHTAVAIKGKPSVVSNTVQITVDAKAIGEDA